MKQQIHRIKLVFVDIFYLACVLLLLFLSFKISIYRLVPFFISPIFAYLRFKNYCCCIAEKNMESTLVNNCENTSVSVPDSEKKLNGSKHILT